jgi:addiction module RelE/StbE family toxin
MGATHQIIFAPQSLRDLEATVRYVSYHNNPEVAVRFGTQLVEKALTLATLPERGRIVPEVGHPYREIIFKSYRIVYRLTGNKVEIIRFWHAARGVPQLDSDDFGRSQLADGHD